MSKFKKTRADKSFSDTVIEQAIINKANDPVPDVIPKEDEPISTSVSVPLNEFEIELLRKLSQIEDRSQRKITRRLLVSAIKVELHKHIP